MIETKIVNVEPINYNLTKDEHAISINNHISVFSPGDSKLDVLLREENNRKIERSRNKECYREEQNRNILPREDVRNQSPNENREKGIELCLQRLSGIDCEKIDYIIQNESSWLVGIENAEGCKGLSQACPGSKLGEYAGTLEGEVTWTINQALIYNRGQYKGLDGAYNHKLLKGWW